MTDKKLGEVEHVLLDKSVVGDSAAPPTQCDSVGGRPLAEDIQEWNFCVCHILILVSAKYKASEHLLANGTRNCFRLLLIDCNVVINILNLAPNFCIGIFLETKQLIFPVKDTYELSAAEEILVLEP